MNRRLFLSWSVVTVGALSFLKSFNAFAKEELKIKDSEVAKDGDKLSVAQFCTDPDGGAKTCPERKKPERKGQYCEGCQFYTAKGQHKGKDVGSCTLIPGKYVSAKAWCQTWVKKAGA